MHIGLIVSLVLHAVLLGWALLAIHNQPPLVVKTPDPVEVAIITADDLVRLKQGDRDAKALEAEGKESPVKEPPKKDDPKPTPPPPTPQAAAPPPPPEPVKPEPPKPDPIAEKLATPPEPPPKPEAPKPEPAKVESPKPDPIGDLAEKTAAEPPPPPKPEPPKPEPPKPPPPKPKPPPPKPPPKPAPPKKPQDFAALMNDALKKTPDSTPPPPLANRAPPKAAPVSGAKTASALKGPTAGAPEGTDKVLTAGERDRLRGLMAAATYRCYNVNAGIEGGNTLAVKFELKFKRDGYLMEEPKLVTPGSGPKFDDAVNNARRALIACQPYSTLPQELYDNGWAWSTFEFIPPK